ncbi:MAG: hypothetical protein Q9159_003784 [Coniocarpon cinnabarinum]
MPPKKAAGASRATSRSGTAPAASTSTAAKANTSSKRKAATDAEPDNSDVPDVPERRSKRVKTATEFISPSAPTTKQSSKEAPKKASAARQGATQSKKPTRTGKSCNALRLNMVSGRLTNPANAAAKSTPARSASKKAATAPKETPTPKSKAKGKEAKPKTAEAPEKKKTPKAEPKPKAAPKPKAPPKPKKPLPVVVEPHTKRLEVLVCGEGENGELGLGIAKGQTGVKRPRLNALLSADEVGVVQVACGGMHILALTHDNRILSWGVNDQGTLGRDTSWEGGLRDIDAGSDSGESETGETGLNPYESTPTAIDASHFPEGTRFAQVAAGDSCSFALTDTGFVYGWGTFRANEGILGFSPTTTIQRTPVKLAELKNITSIDCGANHVLALDKNGNVFAWGSGQQMQLGRKPVERTRASCLIPRQLGVPKKSIVKVACGSFHGFAIDRNDNVWAWGLNNFGECGLEQDAGQSEATVGKPTKVPELCGKGVTCIKGGEHHSVAVNGAGDCIVWGRGDGGQLGIDIRGLEEDKVIRDESGRARIVISPTIVPPIQGRTSMVTAGGDHTLAVTTDGQAWSWGFSALYQTGQGTSEDIEQATRIENTATRDRHITWAGAGGQYSMLGAAVDEDGNTNVDGGA